MMENYLLMKKSQEALRLSKELGFTKTYFLEDFDYVVEKGSNKKDLLNKIKKSKKKGKRVMVRVFSEEGLRFVLEKTQADFVIGVEGIHPKDSVHFLRSGLDQVLCKIAAANKKTIVFSFLDILDSTNREKLLARMKMNVKLCQKYKVRMIFSNFSSSLMKMRSAADLKAWEGVLNIN